ncbi:hypothetical protein [Aridibaculum aurantiacum]|uniref:hypothetical protein n=1 Tax=Aridibaculum aurantiacum TaxID=2810307 RepID=UPI001A969F25|nr:hypothetical protein [Aridibaculum aurantiacum]
MNNEAQQVSQELEKLGVALQPTVSFEELLANLTAFINHLVVHDFQRLILLLYRLDVPEEQLRYYLQQNKGEAAAATIAQMIINRQLQKIETRKKYKDNREIPDDEKW